MTGVGQPVALVVTEPPIERRGWLARLMWFIPEPRVLRLLLAVGYLGLLCSGIAGFFHPPQSVTATLSSLSYVWAGAAVTGAALAAVTVLIGRWWLERIALLLLATAGGVYIVTVLAAFIQTGGDRLPVLGWLWFGVVMVAARYVTIRWSQIEPGR